jgi:hypothetical protein
MAAVCVFPAFLLWLTLKVQDDPLPLQGASGCFKVHRYAFGSLAGVGNAVGQAYPSEPGRADEESSIC